MAATPNELPKIPSFFQALRCECGQAKGAYCDGTHLGFRPEERCTGEQGTQPQRPTDPDEAEAEKPS